MAEKIVLAILSIIIGLMMVAGPFADILDDLLTESYSENFSVNTGVGETTAICTLSYQNYYGDTTDMSVESTSSSDTAAITDYNDTNKQTTVSGLAASTSRILTIDYPRENERPEFEYFVTFVKSIPFLIAVALIWMAVKPMFSFGR